MTTKTTAQILLDRFNNAEIKISLGGKEYYPDRNRMEYELSRLLQDEAEYNMRYSDQKDLDLLQEFKDNFDWDTEYQAVIAWEVEPSTASQYIQCASLEELKEYTNGSKQVDCPSFTDLQDSIEYGSYFTGHSSTSAQVSVENLRPKTVKETEKYLVNLMIECFTSIDSIESHLIEVLQESSFVVQAQVCSVTADA